MDAKHTLGPLVARRINDTAKPFAVINPAGPVGDDIVAGYLNEADAALYAAAPELLAQLKQMVEMYVDMANSGDCGFWNPEEEPEIIAARAAIAKAEAKP